MPGNSTGAVADARVEGDAWMGCVDWFHWYRGVYPLVNDPLPMENHNFYIYFYPFFIGNPSNGNQLLLW